MRRRQRVEPPACAAPERRAASWRRGLCGGGCKQAQVNADVAVNAIVIRIYRVS